MIKCKYCDTECKNITGLARHNRLAHKINIDTFKIKYAELYPKKEITADMVQCKLCNDYMLPLGLPSHLKRKHDIKVIDYYNQYCKVDSKEGYCKICGKPTTFITILEGYRKYCSSKCANLDPEVQDKLKEAMVQKYGVEHPLQSKQIKDKVKQTCLDKYGVTSFMKTKEFRQASIEAIQTDEVKNKRIQTNLEKYGTENVAQNEQVKKKIQQTTLQRYGATNVYASDYGKQKIKETCLERYGVINVAQNEQIKKKIKDIVTKNNGGIGAASTKIKDKMQQTCLDKYGVTNSYQSDIIKEKIEQTRQSNIQKFCELNKCIPVHDLDIEFPFQCIKESKVDVLTYNKNTKFVYLKDLEYIKSFEASIIERVNNNESYGEQEIYQYLQSIYTGTIIQRTKRIITPLELDFYIPDKKVAIEFNGNYWHSINVGTEKDYHLRKTQLCAKLGIRLIHIFEYDWQHSIDICKSIIASALGIYKQKIFARQCNINKVSSIEANKFLEINHIQGSIKATINYGLYYKDELVQLICLGKSRFDTSEIELLRMCTKLNTQVIGGFSKLLKYQPYDDIVSYIDVSKFTGASYEKNQFKLIKQSKPSYVYVKASIVLNRISAQKHKLKDLLGDNYNESETESENMIRNNWLQVYDCGTYKVRWTRNSI